MMLETSHPAAECHFAPASDPDEKVDVVRHEDVPAHVKIEIAGAPAVIQECAVDGVASEQGDPVACVEGDEVNR